MGYSFIGSHFKTHISQQHKHKHKRKKKQTKWIKNFVMFSWETAWKIWMPTHRQFKYFHSDTQYRPSELAQKNQIYLYKYLVRFSLLRFSFVSTAHFDGSFFSHFCTLVVSRCAFATFLNKEKIPSYNYQRRMRCATRCYSIKISNVLQVAHTHISI